MEMTVRLDPVANLRVHHLSGDLAFEEVRRALADLYDDPEFCADQNSLWDLTEARLTTLSAADFRQLAEFITGKWHVTAGPEKAALVTLDDPAFGLARMFEMSTDGSTDIRVFRDVNTAMAWLTGEE